MRDEVFKHLNGCNPRLPLVGNARLPAHTHDHLIVMHAIDEVFERRREDLGIRIHLHKHQLGLYYNLKGDAPSSKPQKSQASHPSRYGFYGTSRSREVSYDRYM